MFRGLVGNGSRPEIGAPVMHGETDVGRILRVAASPGGGFEVLAVLQSAPISDGAALHLGNESKPDLEPVDLPYAVPSGT